jgi:hypothetical protein
MLDKLLRGIEINRKNKQELEENKIIDKKSTSYESNVKKIAEFNRLIQQYEKDIIKLL